MEEKQEIIHTCSVCGSRVDIDGEVVNRDCDHDGAGILATVQSVKLIACGGADQ